MQIYQLKMYGEDYVWILGDLRGSLRNFHDCPIIHTRRSTDGVILISNHNALPGSSESISGLVKTMDFVVQISSHFNESRLQTNESFERKLREANVSMSILAKETYDAIWAMSLTLKRVQEMNFNLSFSHFTYQRRDLLELFLSKMSALKFMGISVGNFVKYTSQYLVYYRVLPQIFLNYLDTDESINIISRCRSR